MKINITQEHVKAVGQAGLKIGKQILIQGSKAVLINGAVSTIESTYEKGFSGIKEMSLDKFLAIDEESKAKRKKKFGLFKRNKKEDKGEVEIVEIEDGNPEDE